MTNTERIVNVKCKTILPMITHSRIHQFILLSNLYITFKYISSSRQSPKRKLLYLQAHQSTFNPTYQIQSSQLNPAQWLPLFTRHLLSVTSKLMIPHIYAAASANRCETGNTLKLITPPPPLPNSWLSVASSKPLSSVSKTFCNNYSGYSKN